MTETIPPAIDMPILYAIGDVHGEAERLLRLHQLIEERHEWSYPGRPRRVIHLGDYVDRGEDSARVIDILIGAQSQAGDDWICLRGNHEAMMFEGLTHATATAYQNWLTNGGQQTIESYEKRPDPAVPQSHIDWLSTLPSIHVEKDAKLIFVHAGIHPIDYPNDREDIYLWTRSRRFFEVEKWDNAALVGWTVIHGHTPTDDFYPEHVEAAASRINLDTGAVFGGRLTAGIFAPGEKVRFIYA